MNRRARYIGVLITCVALASCTETDLAGREITDDESAALETCNDSIDQKLPAITSGVSASDASFITENDQIGVAWKNESAAGEGVIVCFVSRQSGNVTGYNIDGVQVQP